MWHNIDYKINNNITNELYLISVFHDESFNNIIVNLYNFYM
jgi:hypothetical protein